MTRELAPEQWLQVSHAEEGSPSAEGMAAGVAGTSRSCELRVAGVCRRSSDCGKAVWGQSTEPR